MNISFCKEMRKKNWVIFKLVSRQFILQSVQDQTLQTFPCFLNQSFWTHCPCLKFEEFFSTFHLFVYKNSEKLVLHTLTSMYVCTMSNIKEGRYKHLFCGTLYWTPCGICFLLNFPQVQ